MFVTTLYNNVFIQLFSFIFNDKMIFILRANKLLTNYCIRNYKLFGKLFDKLID